MLKQNQKAPLDINVIDQQGQQVSLSKLLGNPIVIYFYPKDNTPGCTKEACGFRDFSSKFEEAGVQVVGVSADSVESHNKFSKKFELPFPLWSDPDKKLLKAFGAIGEKSMFGKKFIGIKRMTFLLDKSGKLVKTWEKVKPVGHPQEILDFIESI